MSSSSLISCFANNLKLQLFPLTSLCFLRLSFLYQLFLIILSLCLIETPALANLFDYDDSKPLVFSENISSPHTYQVDNLNRDNQQEIFSLLGNPFSQFSQDITQEFLGSLDAKPKLELVNNRLEMRMIRASK